MFQRNGNPSVHAALGVRGRTNGRLASRNVGTDAPQLNDLQQRCNDVSFASYTPADLPLLFLFQEILRW